MCKSAFTGTLYCGIIDICGGFMVKPLTMHELTSPTNYETQSLCMIYRGKSTKSHPNHFFFKLTIHKN